MNEKYDVFKKIHNFLIYITVNDYRLISCLYCPEDKFGKTINLYWIKCEPTLPNNVRNEIQKGLLKMLKEYHISDGVENDFKLIISKDDVYYNDNYI